MFSVLLDFMDCKGPYPSAFSASLFTPKESGHLKSNFHSWKGLRGGFLLLSITGQSHKNKEALTSGVINLPWLFSVDRRT